ncbi:MAG TPA: AI-2E family transporter [Thermoanaerobaculia bacterium]|nr:AI-2E family transporter [Thermoanaerobaculia bacterium]
MKPAPPPFDPRPGRPTRFGSFFLLFLVVATAVLFFWMVRMFFVPVLLAAVLATLFHPLYRRLASLTRGRRGAAAFLTCLVLFIVLLLPLYLVIDLVTREALDLFANFDERLTLLSAKTQEVLAKLEGLPLVDRLALDEVDWQATLREGAGTAGGLLATIINRTSRGTLQIVVMLFVTLFTMFYFLLDGGRLVERVRYLVPLETRYEDAIIQRFVSVARASVKGTLVIALIQGVLGGLILWIFGVESPALWTVVMVILSVVPLIGAWVVMYPAAVIQMLLGNVWQGIAIAVITLVLVINVDNLLRPRLVGRDAGMHDLLIFFSTLGGIVTFGAMGFIVGPVIAAFFLSVLDIYSQEYQNQLARGVAAAGPAPGSATAASPAAALPSPAATGSVSREPKEPSATARDRQP